MCINGVVFVLIHVLTSPTSSCTPLDPCAYQLVAIQEYGFDDSTDVQFFNGDNFNEMSPRSRDADYLASWGSAMYKPLTGTSLLACVRAYGAHYAQSVYVHDTA